MAIGQDKNRRWEASLVSAAALIFGFAFSYHLLGRLFEPGLAFDWDFFLELHWVPFYEVTHFHQLPLWNPYKCGGMPMLGNPQSRILTPFFLLHLLVGPVAGLHLEIPLHAAVAWAGAYVLARVLGLGYLAAIAAGSVFASSSWFFLHAAEGHAVFFPSAYLPWILAAAHLSYRKGRLTYAALGGAMVALTLGEGGVYPTTQALLMAALTLIPLVFIERTPRPLLVLMVLSLFAIAFSAVKLLPAAATVLSHPRPVDPLDREPLAALLTAFLSRNQDCYRPWFERWGYHEYGAYLGIFGLLALPGLAAVRNRVAFPWFLAAAFLFLAALGDLGACSPWMLLHRLPIFAWERIPPRFLIPFTLTTGIIAALGVEILAEMRWGQVLAAVLIAIGLADTWQVNAHNLTHIFDLEIPSMAAASQFRQFLDDRTTNMFRIAQADMGAVNCYEYADFSTNVRAYNEPGYRGEEYILGRGQVHPIKWTPNTLTYWVETAGDAVLIINQNYDPSWRLVAGRGDIANVDGILAVRLLPGRQKIQLSYLSRRFLLGGAITICAMLLALGLALTERMQPESSLMDPVPAPDIHIGLMDPALTDEKLRRCIKRVKALAAAHPYAAEALMLGSGSLALAGLFTYPLMGSFATAGVAMDWDRFLQQHWVIYQTIVHFHQFPHWNPYKCGGMPMLGNPESRVLTPFVLLTLWLGPVVGPHLEIPAHLALAFAGSYLLARVQGLSVLAAVIGAGLFAASSWFYLHLAVGHLVFLPFAFLPWVILLLWLSVTRHSVRIAILAGAVLALCLGDGGVHPATYACVVTGLIAAALALSRRSLVPLAMLAVMGVFALGFAAPKLLPAWRLIVQHPRPAFGVEYNSPLNLLTALFSRNQDVGRGGLGRWGFHEYGAYVSLLSLPLLIAGLAKPKRTLIWLFTATILFLLALGDFGRLSPWAMIHQLPVLSSEMVPSRFLIPLTLCLGMIAGFGVDVLRRTQVGRYAGLGLIVLAFSDLLAVGPPSLYRTSQSPAPSRSIPESFRQYRDRTNTNMLALSRENLGALNCYEYTFFPASAAGWNDTGYEGEQYVIGAGRVTLAHWSPNVLDFAVHAASPLTVVINQNFDAGWASVNGYGQPFPYNGLLAVEVPAGDQHLRLVYSSCGFRLGFTLAGMAFLAAAIVFLYDSGFKARFSRFFTPWRF